MGRRFQSGDGIVFPVPAILDGTDGGPRTILVVGKANTSAIQELVYTRSTGAHGWWFELDSTGGFHMNYGTGTTLRNVGTAGTGAAEIWTGRKDAGGSVSPIGRRFSGASFATDSGDVSPGTTLTDGTPIDTTYGVAWGRWGNTGSDYSNDWEHYFTAIWNSLVDGATLAGLTKTEAGILVGSPDYWMSCEGSTVTDSAGGSPTITGTTTVSDPAGFFGSGFSAALPVATRSAVSIAVPGLKSRALPAATRTAPALSPAGLKSRTLPPATRTASLLALPGVKSRALPAAARTAVTTVTAGLKNRALAVAVRTSVAVTLTNGGIAQSLPVAVRMAVASALTGFKRRELPPATRYGRAVALAGGEDEGDRAMDLGAIMDELAAKLRLAPSLAGRTFAYPPASIKAPAAIVSYPDDYTFDATYGRGMDRMTGEVIVAVGRPHERQSRDLLTKYVNGAGPESVKALLDGGQGAYSSCDSVRVASAVFDVVIIGGVEYLAAVFSVDIAGRGVA